MICDVGKVTERLENELLGSSLTSAGEPPMPNLKFDNFSRPIRVGHKKGEIGV